MERETEREQWERRRAGLPGGSGCLRGLWGVGAVQSDYIKKCSTGALNACDTFQFAEISN